MNRRHRVTEHKSESKRKAGLLVAPSLATLVYLAPFPNLPNQAHLLAAILTWVVISWITEAIPLAMTSLLGASFCVVAGLGSVTSVFSAFAHPIIFLFIGSFFLAEAFVVHQLDRRFAVWLLSLPLVNAKPGRLFLAMGLATALLSMWISNTAAVAIMVPMALGILSTLRHDPLPTPYESGVMLLLAYGAAAGGIATMIGTPPNLIGVGLLSQQAGISLSFFEWFSIGFPLTCVMFLLIYIVLTWLHPPPREFPALSGRIHALTQEQGAWTSGQRNTCLALGLAVGGWIVPGLLAIVLGRDAELVIWLNARFPKELVPIFASGLLFILPVNFKAAEFTLTWAQAKNINWGTILLFGGGLAFGHLMVKTGLANIIGQELVTVFGGQTLWNLTAVAIGAALILTEIASNTASASMLVPVVIAIAEAAGVSPIPPTLGVCLAASLAFVLPVSTPPNAIVYGTGLVPIQHMLRAGLLLDIMGAILIWTTLWLLCPLLGLA
ncbi:DASS family sodium-coupled anion symporter [Candidatus Nitronereus thalassa]|uniref:DASS family sodium-coupled anion symporter n=1 Tax=Candidatus Nitronereus thalassa TaxID=3020898 RepID=A0ABU3K9L4_9BACT|nr:DASS family sodium-coupled anion symporter [Candidatus Nitronereus thalassa]MDT7043083.1 DASS family sodium-coupled anion symporter [Candidatus Nitronereus thalassa]